MRVALMCTMFAGCGFSSQAVPSGVRGDAANDQPHDAQVEPPGLNDASASCPTTYTLHFGGHSYRKTAAVTDYTGVVNDCHDGSGYVVAVDGSDEDTWIESQFGSNGYIWIGLHLESSGYQWDNHVQLGTYNNFAGKMVPTGPTDPCVDKSLSPWTGGVWSPFACTQTHLGMCECDAP